ncbi:MAG: hypothetical protein JSW43_09630 [Gemmatimonadota bacterium]|nr:MAG: hypothetical protein JSW43_09630 [Gemmatimonadota bacterium]
MRLRRLGTAWQLTLRGLLRRRIVLLLFFLVPSLFGGLIVLTTTSRPIQFQLASLGEAVFVTVPQRHEGLVFICLTAVGLLTAFLALDLVQRDAETHRRLVLCGYRPGELVAARLGVLLCVIALVAAYVVSLLPIFFEPERFGLVLLGLILGGWVYGCYGLLVGAVFRRELEGVLFVVLLAAIDVGWLQNPIYYAEAQNQAIIRSLPAYFPAQVSMAAAFTAESVLRPAVGSVVYGAGLLALALLVYVLRMRAGRR